ncbi:L,D-transpeptidase family protein [Oribacterium sp. WCC10]|uniref:L,D-transpeptidase family protein n=1 Tax=Oribacterium sp. WCC10 TaxID=1855343 RepID=UPI0008EF8470|nr:L,D-transpeptidase family protein [Oribacterium sp. WCC10]SFG09687.1 Putative peptidoglycan binding domain-containing protein [Oribacterium sp. WCC10]
MKSKGIAIILGVTAGLTAGYLASTAFMMNKMMPGTIINGADFSMIPREELNQRLSALEQENYSLTVRDIHGNDTVINGTDIDLSADYQTSDIRVQNPLIYPYYMLNPGTYFIAPASVSYDEDKLMDIINNTILPQAGSTVVPEDAYLTNYIPGVGYAIAEEVDGDTPDAGKVSQVIKDAISEGTHYIDLTSSDCYLKASVRRDDTSLNSEAVSLNDALSASITYDFGNQKITLNSDTYYPWLITEEDGTVTLDKKSVEEYVSRLKSSTDTAYTTRSFKTVSGRMINVKGPYGYNISKKKEAEQLEADILSGTTVEREPVYTTTGKERSAQEYGTTYIEVDMSNQTVYFVQDGQVVFTSDCVTGNTSLGRGTPTGLFSIMYKAKNVVLRGANYASPVTYWMPFYNGCGFHDASWRGSFGGNIYRYSGSHGCVNMPIPKAKELYGLVEAGMPVIIYY